MSGTWISADNGKSETRLGTKVLAFLQVCISMRYVQGGELESWRTGHAWVERFSLFPSPKKLTAMILPLKIRQKKEKSTLPPIIMVQWKMGSWKMCGLRLQMGYFPPCFLVNTIKMVDFPWRTVIFREGINPHLPTIHFWGKKTRC